MIFENLSRKYLNIEIGCLIKFTIAVFDIGDTIRIANDKIYYIYKCENVEYTVYVCEQKSILLYFHFICIAIGRAGM